MRNNLNVRGLVVASLFLGSLGLSFGSDHVAFAANNHKRESLQAAGLYRPQQDHCNKVTGNKLRQQAQRKQEGQERRGKSRCDRDEHEPRAKRKPTGPGKSDANSDY